MAGIELSPEIISGIVGLPAAVWLIYKRVSATASKEDVSITANKTTSSVIELLHDEIKRLGDQNAKLSNMVDEMRAENARQRHQLLISQQILKKLAFNLRVLSVRKTDVPFEGVDRRRVDLVNHPPELFDDDA